MAGKSDPTINYIRDWVRAEIENVSAEHTPNDHIDEILQTRLTEEEYLTESLSAYIQLIKEINLLNNIVQPVLIIPLISKKKSIQMSVPSSFAQIKREIDIERPSLYLMSWEKPKKYAISEEFVSPLKFPLFHDFGKEIYTYFREFRYAQAIAYDWEFSRDVHIEYFPNGSF